LVTHPTVAFGFDGRSAGEASIVPAGIDSVLWEQLREQAADRHQARASSNWKLGDVWGTAG